eukprot:3500485-Rhodomonas_salina.3
MPGGELEALVESARATLRRYQPMRLLRHVRYCHSVWRCVPIRDVRYESTQRMVSLAYYALPRTDLGYSAITLCACYAMSGTDLGYGATRATLLEEEVLALRLYTGTELDYAVTRACAKSGTDLGYTATRPSICEAQWDFARAGGTRSLSPTSYGLGLPCYAICLRVCLY